MEKRVSPSTFRWLWGWTYCFNEVKMRICGDGKLSCGFHCVDDCGSDILMGLTIDPIIKSSAGEFVILIFFKAGNLLKYTFKSAQAQPR